MQQPKIWRWIKFRTISPCCTLKQIKASEVLEVSNDIILLTDIVFFTWKMKAVKIWNLIFYANKRMKANPNSKFNDIMSLANISGID